MKPTVRLRHTTWLASAVLGTTLPGCGKDYTCYDLANCPLDSDGGLESTASGDPHTESGTPTEGGPSTPESSPTASESTRLAGSSRETSTSQPEPTPSASSQGTLPESDACEADSSCECEDGETIDCWELPDGTPISDDPEDAIGDCRLGQKACTKGTWSACEGAVAPEPTDACDRPLADNNCDGVPNEGCTCTPNETRTCGTDVGPCTTGIQTCGSDGKWESACEGEIHPASKDRCDAVNDDNCNDNPNDGCECVGNEVAACNECGQKTCDPDTGRWGACEPVEDERCNEDGSGIDVCGSEGNWEYSACENADATHCSVECETVGGSPTCVVSAKDTDEDGYTSAACVQAPGADCDDTTELVNPLSTEVCDGLDNDCDGYADVLDSSVQFAGVPTHLTGAPDLRRVDLTWHESDFFLVADGKKSNVTTSVTQIYGGTTAGGITGLSFNTLALKELVTDGGDWWYNSPRVASANGLLGATVLMDGRSWGTQFMTLTDAGAVTTSVGFAGPPGGGDLVPNGTSFVIATHRAPTGEDPNYTFTFATGTSTGTTTNITTRTGVSGSVDNQNAAQVGTTTGVVYTDFAGTQPAVNLMRWSAGSIQGPIELAKPAQLGDITSLSSGNFGIAWATSDGFRVQVRTTNGTTIVCDSQEIAFGNGTLDPSDGVAIAESSLGILLFASDSGGVMGRGDLFVFDEACQLLSDGGKSVFNRNSTSYSKDRPHLPRIAVGGGKVGLAWTAEKSDLTDEYTSYALILPEAMCE